MGCSRARRERTPQQHQKTQEALTGVRFDLLALPPARSYLLAVLVYGGHPHQFQSAP
jgi:hypothetical protein